MRKLLVLLFLLIGAACVTLVLTGVQFAPPAVKKSEMPKQLRDDLNYVTHNKKESPVKVFFSHREFFYDRPIQAGIQANRPTAKIYYTLDGSEPGPHSTPYTGPIPLDVPDKTACTVIKAVAVDGGVSSRTQTHSYFMGRDVKQRFGSYVFSLSGEPQDFFGSERGILVPGKIYDDFMRSNEKKPDKVWKRPANYNMHGVEWERPVVVEAFTPDGNRILHQHAGVRVKGESSRGSKQKSLRLIARKRYEPKHGKFKYNFFPELLQENGYGAPVAPYGSLVLGTSGSVYAGAQLIDPLITRQARKAGYSYVSPVRSAAVFLNGEYYGHTWLSVQMDDEFLKKLCGTPDADYEILLGGGHTVFTKNPIHKTEFKLLHYYARQDMTDDAVFADFAEKMDVHNVLLYMAVQLYVGNTDWPRNNMKIWRYNGQPSADNAYSQGADGRWRYLLFDLEVSMHTELGKQPADHNNPDPVDADPEKHRAGYYGSGPVQNARKTIQFVDGLLQRRELRDEFANHMCDMAFVHFPEGEAVAVAKELHAESIKEFRHAATDTIGGGEPRTEARLNALLERIALFCRERPAYVLQELRDLFGYTDLFTIRVQGAPARINTSGTGEGRYFVESTVPVAPALPKGRVFDHWLVNGEKRTEERLLLSGKDAVDGVAEVVLVSREVSPPLYLAEPFDKGKLCGFSLRNGTDRGINTDGLYLSDKLRELKKFPMPSMTVAPGGTINFVGQSYQTTDAMLKVELGFNPRTNEVVFLSDENGTILDYIVVP